MTATGQLKISDIREWFYQPGKANAIDAVHPRTGRGVYSGETLDEVRLRYPGAVIATWETIEKAHTATFTKPPVEVTAEDWDYALNVLPPVAWINRGGAETFKMSERDSGDITAIYCRIGDRFAVMHDSIRLSHDEIAQACLKVIGA